MSNHLLPLNPEQLERFARIAGLNLDALQDPLFKNAWFQRKHSIVFYTGDLSLSLSPDQTEGIVIADWLGQKTLRIYPTFPVLLSKAFQNVVQTDSPYFIQGRNLLPSQFQWVKRESDAIRALVTNMEGIPLGIGLRRLSSDGKEMFINEVDIGQFFRQERKTKRRIKR